MRNFNDEEKDVDFDDVVVCAKWHQTKHIGEFYTLPKIKWNKNVQVKKRKKMPQKERWNGVLLGETMNALCIDMFYGVRCECIFTVLLKEIMKRK